MLELRTYGNKALLSVLVGLEGVSGKSRGSVMVVLLLAGNHFVSFLYHPLLFYSLLLDVLPILCVYLCC